MIKNMNYSSCIGIKFEIEGVHCWEGVDKVEGLSAKVGYLKHPHRHLFKFDCVFHVNHDDRDKEFIATKHVLVDILNGHFWDETLHLCNFGNMSCEMIAKWLLQKYEGEMFSCEVSEDGENYAFVYAEEKCEIKESDIEDGPNVVAVLGGIASGKSYIANRLADSDTYVVEIGQIVRYITQQEGRVFDSNLDHEIVEKCKELYMLYKNRGIHTIIFVGPRTHYVMQALQSLSKDKFKVIVVNAGYDSCKKRYEQAARDKDNGLSFEEASLKDAKLGVNELIMRASRGVYGKVYQINNDEK